MSGTLLCKEIDDLHSEIIFGMGSTDDAIYRMGCDAANRLAEIADDAISALESIIKRHSGWRGDSPGHSHNVSGRWDKDGSECEACREWNKARLVVALAKGSVVA